MEIDFDKTSFFYKTFNLTGLILSECNQYDDNGLIGSLQSNKYKMIVAMDCNDNIDENIDSYGALDYTQVTKAQLSNSNTVEVNVPLTWDNELLEVKITSDTTFNIGADVVDMKAIYLVHASNDVVVAYDIFINPIPITNSLIFEKDLIICKGE